MRIPRDNRSVKSVAKTSPGLRERDVLLDTDGDSPLGDASFESPSPRRLESVFVLLEHVLEDYVGHEVVFEFQHDLDSTIFTYRTFRDRGARTVTEELFRILLLSVTETAFRITGTKRVTPELQVNAD